MEKNKKINTLLLALALIFVMFTTSAKAGEVYTAVAKGYYNHPITHVVEDPGNKPGIGEGMVDNVVYGVALIEKDDNGKLYATVRYNLRDKIKDIQVWVQNRGDSGFSQVPVEEVANTGPTGDFRFEIPSADCIIKSSFFVEPMGRAVIFFMDFDDLQEGAGNGFKVSVRTDNSTSNEDASNDTSRESKSPAKPNVQEKNKNNESKKNTSKINKSANKASDNRKEKMNKKSKKEKGTLTSSNKNIGKPVNSPGTDDNDEKINQSDLGYDHGLLTNKDFDDSQTLIGTSQKDEARPWGPFTRALFTILIVMISIVFTIIMLGALGIVILYNYKKRKNIELEEQIANEDTAMTGGDIND